MSRFWQSFCGLAFCLVTGFFAAQAHAEEYAAPEDLRSVALADAVTPGWKTTLSLGTTFSFNQADSVVGTPDGISAQIGILADGQSEYRQGRHTWTNTLKAQFATSKTPSIDRFIKSADGLDLGTTYTFGLPQLRWVGPYVRARFSTQFAPGYLVKAAAFDVARIQPDGGRLPVEHYAAQQFVQLTGSFDPMLFGESVGLFANPTESEAVTVKLKLGIGSQQLVTTSGNAVVDDATPPEIEVKQMRSATQVGGEAEAQANGKVSKALTWKAKATLFMPFYTSIDNTATGIDALNADFSAGASYRLAKWLSLDYVFSAKRVPLISEKWQVQNGVLLTVGFIL